MKHNLCTWTRSPFTILLFNRTCASRIKYYLLLKIDVISTNFRWITWIMAFLRHYSSDELSRSLHSAADKFWRFSCWTNRRSDSFPTWANSPRYTDLVLRSAGQCSVEGITDTAYNELVGKMYLWICQPDLGNLLFSKLLLSVGTFFARFRQVHHQVLQLWYHRFQLWWKINFIPCLLEESRLLAWPKETPPATKTATARGQYSVVFASPEALARSGRALLATDVYNIGALLATDGYNIGRIYVDFLLMRVTALRNGK